MPDHQADDEPAPGDRSRSGEAPAPGMGAEERDEEGKEAEQQLSLAEWKAQQMKQKALSTRERLRDEYAKQAAQIKLGDRCEIGGYKGEVAFLGDEIAGLPGGFWVGIRYDEPVGKNDGTVKGKRLFHCHPNCGHLVRPDKVLEGAIAAQGGKSRRPTSPLGNLRSQSPTAAGVRPSTTAGTLPARRPDAASTTRAHDPAKLSFSSDDDDDTCAARPNSMASTSPGRIVSQEVVSEVPLPRARSFSPVRSVLVTKKEDPGNRRYEKWQNIDPATIIGTDPELDELLPRHRTGLVYDTRMEAHRSPGAFHPEQPLRITAIFAALADMGLAQKCWRVPARCATASELETVHTAEHVQNICNLSSKSQGDLNDMAANLDSVFLCPKSGSAALLASGSVVEATRMVSQGKIARACCVVRPPGHHALPSCAMGFCLFGNVAVAAKEARKRGWAQRVLIFDWDVHHGNGTQKMFWEDDSVLCFSVHRHDRGNFYPGGPEGDNYWVGEGDGRGYNINVPWPKSGAGDEEYKVVVDELLRPIANEYKPDLVLISAGFDAAQGDPLGGCHITPAGYYMMTKACKEFANGKVVIALEGGYSLRATAQSMASCVAALLDPSKNLNPVDATGPSSAPSSPPSTPGSVYLDAIEEARKIQAHFWKSVRRPDDVLDYSRFSSPSSVRSSRASKSAAASQGTGGWQVKPHAAGHVAAQRTPVASPATPAGPDWSESKSLGATPSTASKPWAARATAATLKAADNMDSSESLSRGSVSPSPASTPVPPALSTPAVGKNGTGSGIRPRVGPGSVRSASSTSSLRSWQDWYDDSD